MSSNLEIRSLPNQRTLHQEVARVIRRESRLPRKQRCTQDKPEYIGAIFSSVIAEMIAAAHTSPWRCVCFTLFTFRNSFGIIVTHSQRAENNEKCLCACEKRRRKSHRHTANSLGCRRCMENVKFFPSPESR